MATQEEQSIGFLVCNGRTTCVGPRNQAAAREGAPVLLGIPCSIILVAYDIIPVMQKAMTSA